MSSMMSLNVRGESCDVNCYFLSPVSSFCMQVLLVLCMSLAQLSTSIKLSQLSDFLVGSLVEDPVKILLQSTIARLELGT